MYILPKQGDLTPFNKYFLCSRTYSTQHKHEHTAQSTSTQHTANSTQHKHTSIINALTRTGMLARTSLSNILLLNPVL